MGKVITKKSTRKGKNTPKKNPTEEANSGNWFRFRTIPIEEVEERRCKAYHYIA